VTEVEYVSFYRFDHQANEVPKHDHVVNEYLLVCEKHLESEPGKVVKVDQWPPYSLRCEHLSLDFWPAFLDSRIKKWDAKIANLVQSLCEAGGLSVIFPKAVLVVERSQADQIPELWRKHREIIFCEDGTAMYTLSKKFQFDIPIEQRDYGFKLFGGPLPGSFPSRCRTIYIEAFKGETPLKHQRLVYKHKHSDPEVSRPESGLVKKEFWEVATPSGVRFFAYGYAGIGWLDLLQDFARSTNRKHGEIVNFETFTVADDRIRIDKCNVGKVEPA
jgi:hypothetical protein